MTRDRDIAEFGADDPRLHPQKSAIQSGNKSEMLARLRTINNVT
jgi:hypothetical protein